MAGIIAQLPEGETRFLRVDRELPGQEVCKVFLNSNSLQPTSDGLNAHVGLIQFLFIYLLLR